MPVGNSCDNRFLSAPVGRLFVVNALPTMLVMTMSGLLNVVDAMFLGHFVGADALTAVSLVFPAVMVVIALSTLVSGGMSSLLARHLGAGQGEAATAVFARAHGLSLFISLLLIASHVLFGPLLIRQIAGSADDAGRMAQTYLMIMVISSPVQFLLGVHADTWRNEGRMALVALLSALVTLANVGLNYVLIVMLDLGVAGSAWGTALAQGVGLGILVWLRAYLPSAVPLSGLLRHRWSGNWSAMVALGAPLSLGYVGIAVVAATLITALRMMATPDYAAVVAAHGIVTRILGLTYLPLMAMALATQSIVGNNCGAGLHQRADAALRLALGVSLIYCGLVELMFQAASDHIGASFSGEPDVVSHVAAILRPMLAVYLFTGPVLILALYFQAIGKPGRAAVLTLCKPFVLCPALILALAATRGSTAIRFAFPLADSLMALIGGTMLALLWKSRATWPADAGRGTA
ncbi:MATE family efflux transporter [Paracoccus sp. (in: a-proteobacteria)]|uniref:MATE family efflux transporter n=1 Tax=Paracoccus sp. TaxID=267 RepID=UPI00396CF51A